MKRFLSIILFVCFFSASFGLNFRIDNISYTTLDETSVKVSGFAFSLIDVVIPPEVTYNNVTYQVKEIGDKGLYGYNSTATTKNSKMETLVISEGIEKIGVNGIASNKKLKTVSLPSTLMEIGNMAFNNDENIQSVQFPNGSNLQSIGEKAFNECKNMEFFEIPSTVSSIGSYAFYNNEKMESFTIPENVTIIEEHTFSQCSSLKTIVLHDKLTHINDAAFLSCKELSNIDNDLPASLEYLGGSAFNGVPGFKHLILSGNLKIIYSNTFANCENLEYVWLQEGITRIGQSAFSKCPNLKYVVLPSTLKTVEQSAFGGFTTTNHISRTFIFLADEPCETKFFYTPDYYGINRVDYNSWSFGSVAEGDRFYMKESVAEVGLKWSSAKDKTDYKIPFNADLTYSTNYREFDMDFHVAASKGNKPFVATNYSDNSVTFTSIDDYIVPAETGIVIRKTSDEDTWYQIAEQQGNTLSMNNYLKGITYSDILPPTTDNGEVNFVLYNGVFCKFSNAGMLGDHKAYLQLPTQTAESSLSFSFSDIPDGIKEIEHENGNDIFYNLKGMQIKHPRKGLYIKNGKKIIFK